MNIMIDMESACFHPLGTWVEESLLADKQHSNKFHPCDLTLLKYSVLVFIQIFVDN